MPLEFLKRKNAAEPTPEVPARPSSPSITLPEEVIAQEYQLKLYYAGKSSEGVRMRTGPNAMAELPSMLHGLAKSEIEMVEPLPIEFSQATPVISRPSEAMQWLNAHHIHSPVTRHALVVLESIDAVDLAFDTFICSLLDGETDTSGYPEYNAIVGGLASHWDELSGELIVRAVIGWGGKGLRGDTERIGQKLLSSLYQQVLASGYSLGEAEQARLPSIGARSGLTCAHCGYEAGNASAFYCPKCGMRMARG
jgi:hypothetical protein